MLPAEAAPIVAVVEICTSPDTHESRDEEDWYPLPELFVVEIAREVVEVERDVPEVTRPLASVVTPEYVLAVPTDAKVVVIAVEPEPVLSPLRVMV